MTRDDIVRAVMPELKVLLQHLVDTSVERAIAPLLNKQRELESALKELRNAQVHPEPKPAAAATHTPEARAVHAQPAIAVARAAQPVVPETVAASGAPAIALHASSLPSQVVRPTAFDAASLEDIPRELLGSRRKKIILWVIGAAVLLTVVSAVVLSILSNRGTYL